MDSTLKPHKAFTGPIPEESKVQKINMLVPADELSQSHSSVEVPKKIINRVKVVSEATSGSLEQICD